MRDFLLGVGRLLLPTAALWLGVAHGREVRLVTPRTSSTAASGGGQRRGDAHAAGGRCDRWAPGVPLAAGSMLLLLLGATFSLLSFAVGPKAWWFDAAAAGCDLLTAQFRCWAQVLVAACSVACSVLAVSAVMLTEVRPACSVVDNLFAERFCCAGDVPECLPLVCSWLLSTQR